MEEQIRTLIEKYEEELETVKGFNPCYTCCDLTAANTTESVLEDFLKDLKDIDFS